MSASQPLGTRHSRGSACGLRGSRRILSRPTVMPAMHRIARSDPQFGFLAALPRRPAAAVADTWGATQVYSLTFAIARPLRTSRRQPARLCALLVGVRGLVDRGLVERPPHQLEANRKPARGEAAWDRERWKAGECRHQAVASGCSLRQKRRCMVEARIQEGIEALLGHDLHDRRAQRLAHPQLLEKDRIVRALSYVVAQRLAARFYHQ